jgi:SAM-dependent methyltransferase
MLPGPRRRFELIARLVGPAKGLLLDIGCGDMQLTRFLLTKTTDLSAVGLDRDFKTPVRNGRRLTAIRSDACALPFNDETFDLIVCSETLEHIQDDQGAVREIDRVLKDGCQCVVSVPYARCEDVVPLKGLIRRMYQWQREQNGHLRDGYTGEELDVLFGQCSLLPECRHYDLKLVGALWELIWYWIASMRKAQVRRFLSRLYREISRVMGMTICLDDLMEKRGFTLFAVYTKMSQEAPQ